MTLEMFESGLHNERLLYSYAKKTQFFGFETTENVCPLGLITPCSLLALLLNCVFEFISENYQTNCKETKVRNSRCCNFFKLMLSIC